jgi:hypothetical protein
LSRPFDPTLEAGWLSLGAFVGLFLLEFGSLISVSKSPDFLFNCFGGVSALSILDNFFFLFALVFLASFHSDSDSCPTCLTSNAVFWGCFCALSLAVADALAGTAVGDLRLGGFSFGFDAAVSAVCSSRMVIISFSFYCHFPILFFFLLLLFNTPVIIIS